MTASRRRGCVTANRRRGRAAVGLLAAVVLAGCGSRVERARLEATGGALSAASARLAAAGRDAPNGAATAATALPADGPVASPSGGTGTTGGANAPVAAGRSDAEFGSNAASALPAQSSGRAGRSPGQPTAGTGSSAAAAANAGAAGAGGQASGATPGPGAAPTPGPGKPGGAPTAARAPILFGTMGTGSGVIGRAVQPIITANKAWSADINARGGLAGHPVKLIFGDDGGDPAAALAIAKRMVEQDKVVAFIGTYLVTTTPAVTPYLEQAGVPMVGGPGGNEIEDHSPMVFNPQIGSDEALGHGIHLAVTSQTDKRKMAILYCREASSCKQQRDRALQFAPLYGMTIVYEAQVSIAQPDFTAEVISARNAGAEIVTMLTDEQTIVRVARSAHRQGWNPVVTGTYTANAEVMQQPDAEGVLGIAATVPYRSSP